MQRRYRGPFMAPGSLRITEQLAELITALGAEWVMWLLLGLSVLSISVMAERLWFYRRRKLDVPALAADLAGQLEADDVDGGRGVLVSAEERGALEPRVAIDMLDALDRGADVVEQRMALALARELPAYERGLSFLGTLGNNAPFIGLFGTVLGIIKAFANLSGDVRGGAEVVMAGISEALVATAIGLLVALPAVVAFNVFRGRVKETRTGADLLARTLLAHAHHEEEVAAAALASETQASETAAPTELDGEEAAGDGRDEEEAA